jgi:hypothetical protein
VRKCGILDVSQPHGPARPVRGIVLLQKGFKQKGKIERNEGRREERK